MKLVILADEMLQEELSGKANDSDVVWINDAQEFAQYRNADGYIDLLFDSSEGRIELLKTLFPKPVIVNSVVTTLSELNAPFIRFNAWPGFLRRPLAEATNTDKNGALEAEKIFSFLNKKTKWVVDKPGFVTARVIAMIINEAYFAVGEGVSAREEVDKAMKLGTSYPYGPFEWCNRIGIKNIFRLLKELEKTNSRYKPADLLEQEAIASWHLS